MFKSDWIKLIIWLFVELKCFFFGGGGGCKCFYKINTFSVCLFALLGAENAILQKAEEKLRLAQSKTQLFDKSCVLGPGKKCVQNAQYLWTAGGP